MGPKFVHILMSTLWNSLVMIRGKSGIFGQTSEFGQPPCLFHRVRLRVFYKTPHTHTLPLKQVNKQEDLEALPRSPDHLNNLKIGQSQLRLIIETFCFYKYMGVVAILHKIHYIHFMSKIFFTTLS